MVIWAGDFSTDLVPYFAEISFLMASTSEYTGSGNTMAMKYE
jgi:hypothetical protein